jgi:hypothetical protein
MPEGGESEERLDEAEAIKRLNAALSTSTVRPFSTQAGARLLIAAGRATGFAPPWPG